MRVSYSFLFSDFDTFTQITEIAYIIDHNSANITDPYIINIY